MNIKKVVRNVTAALAIGLGVMNVSNAKALATPQPSIEYEKSTLYDFYSNLYSQPTDLNRNQWILEQILADPRIRQNYIHNQYSEMRDESRKLNDAGKRNEKLLLTGLYAWQEGLTSNNGSQTVRVFLSDPKDIKKYLVFEQFGNLNPTKKHVDGSLILDVHTHQGEIGMSYDSLGTLRKSLIESARRGIDAVVLTNHDTINLRQNEVVSELKREGKIPQNFTVINGEEYSSSDAGHLLVLGVKKNLAPGLTLAEVLKEVHAQKGVVIAAHPGGVYETLKQVKTDGAVVDSLNPRTLFTTKKLESKQIALFGASDSHYPSWYGVNCTRVYTDDRSEEGILEAIRQRKTEPVFFPLIQRLREKYGEKGDKVRKKYENKLKFLDKIDDVRDKLELGLARRLGADYVSLGNFLDISDMKIGFGKTYLNLRPADKEFSFRWASEF
ncbi:hypothetical protein HZA33_00755 [Candidatus Pacearchaeota archaeon]|nr:hypothetical protein [Candidatus Pacearchaeota archaeon]